MNELKDQNDACMAAPYLEAIMFPKRHRIGTVRSTPSTAQRREVRKRERQARRRNRF